MKNWIVKIYRVFITVIQYMYIPAKSPIEFTANCSLFFYFKKSYRLRIPDQEWRDLHEFHHYQVWFVNIILRFILQIPALKFGVSDNTDYIYRS